MALSQKNKVCNKVKLGRISQYTVGFVREIKKLFGVKFQIYDADEEDDYNEEIEEDEDEEIKDDFIEGSEDSLDEIMQENQPTPK